MTKKGEKKERRRERERERRKKRKREEGRRRERSKSFSISEGRELMKEQEIINDPSLDVTIRIRG